MKYSELLKKLKKAGWRLERNGSSHDLYTNPQFPGVQVPIARHQSKEVPTGTLNKILSDTGLK